MVNLTREETIKAVEACKSEDCANCLLYEYENCVELREINVLHHLKEKEPAPSGNGTSPQNKTLQGNNTTKNPLCQALAYVDDAINTILESYENMSDEEQRIFDIGTTYTNMLEARKVLEKLKGGEQSDE